MTVEYAFRHVEKSWQKRWKELNAHVITDPTPGEKKLYVLEMLPYPSGKLHMGHVRNYSIGDALSCFYTKQGYKVLHPMGWDAFGLPAENAAIQNNTPPAKWTYENIASMKDQMEQLGFGYDWNREVTTCAPDYYGHEQKIFLDMYAKGLAYRKNSLVNWDPQENTVLANEQVINGRGWRSGVLVERRQLTQWSIRITDYAQELLDDLKTLSGWPEKVVKMQENWIGRSEGAMVDFRLTTPVSLEQGTSLEDITVYTTRPETLFGASFLALAPNHPLCLAAASGTPGLAGFIKASSRSGVTEEALSTMEKLGYDTGLTVAHPFDASITLPVYAANFVLMDYGTGALFGCPAHDERDHEFALKYNLPVKRVIDHADPLPYTGTQGVMIDSGFLSGLNPVEAKERVIAYLEEHNLGKRKVNFRLRDWLVSRQRYWGCPIPVIHCETCGVVPVPLEDLPVTLPDDVSFDKPGNPLEHHATWKHTTCPTCQAPALRETDTLDTFFESSWYFLRYCCAKSSEALDASACETWMATDWYIGGIEHAVLHLLYARFFTKALRDLGYFKGINEPFTNLITQGMVCHQTYQDEQGKWLYPDEVTRQADGSFVHRTTGKPATAGRMEKMSKSKKNLVDPQTIIDTYGADCARLFILSDTPVDKDFDWNEDGLEGCWRYLNRLWRLGEQVKPHLQSPANHDGTLPDASLQFKAKAHRYLDLITKSYQDIALNKVIAYCRELTRLIDDALAAKVDDHVIHESWHFLLHCLTPVTPHITHELWRLSGHEDLIGSCPWPVADEKLLSLLEITIAVQVNGKTRTTFTTAPDSDEDTLTALAHEAAKPWMDGKTEVKTIVIPGRLVNIVVR